VKATSEVRVEPIDVLKPQQQNLSTDKSDKMKLLSITCAEYIMGVNGSIRVVKIGPARWKIGDQHEENYMGCMAGK